MVNLCLIILIVVSMALAYTSTLLLVDGLKNIK